MERAARRDDLGIEKFIVKSNFRYERKFTAGHLSTHQVLQAVKLHPSFFREIYYKRQVNNIYFDTPDLTFLRHNQIGIADRKKVRIRWYGTNFNKVTNPVLEIKIKKGLVGDKWSYPVEALMTGDILNPAILKNIINRKNIPLLIKEMFLQLKPTLINSYQRQYFQSIDKRYRITIDSELTYRKVSSLNSISTPYLYKELHTIVELKYGLEDDLQVDSISSKFPFRLDKSSKYVNGMEQT